MSIEVRHVSKTFGSFKALDDVSLVVPAGKLVALLGPSGSGKTTLLRIMAGLEQADRGSGKILFHEEDVVGTHVRHRRVGFVFQHYALFRHMTVFGNVAFGMRVKRRAERPSKEEIRARVHELLRLVQLEGLAGRYPHQLSGGQRQRVALARALAVQPRVLLLDEPFGALDAKVRKELRSWLRRLHDDIGITSVFVTHDQDEALEVADEVVVMNKGRIEQVGTPDDVFHHPSTEFVMQFLGEVNTFHAEVGGGRVRFGSLDAPYPHFQQQVAGDARVFVRPHDVTIDTKTNGVAAMSATVQRVHSAGASVRVEVLTSQGQTLIAELSQDRFASMGIAAGSTVYIRPRHIRVFGANPA
ncbi:MAG: sulfate/molybdate ABC transporter ATP-binding protein [Phycisphaeraceae bacterium]|nr:sulfate/molybdate ABC transporter ATP-binding protein [Phycisphaeraceae bacterium]